MFFIVIYPTTSGLEAFKELIFALITAIYCERAAFSLLETRFWFPLKERRLSRFGSGLLDASARPCGTCEVFFLEHKFVEIVVDILSFGMIVGCVNQH